MSANQELKSDALMEQMKQHLASDAGKQLTKKINLVYQINIAPKKLGFNEVVYTVDLKKGEVTKDFLVKEAAGEEPARTLKRPRLVWTPQLHKRFVDAVAHLGIKNAVPETIMQLMSVDGLTRENVASHLQKYRLYLKRMQGVSAGGGGSGPAFSSRLAHQNCDLGPYEGGKPDATFSFKDDDFVKVALGKMNPQIAFMRGAMKIKGSLSAAQKFTPDIFPKPSKM